jgi:NTP pyrophosphatase (non-canonical NTP hydrolase)
MTQDFATLNTHALEVAAAYDDLSTSRIGRPWTNQEVALGFVGDVGDLAKIVMTLEGTRRIDGVGMEQLEHELCDAIWSCLVLADRYGIDISEAFPRQMRDLVRHVSELRADETSADSATPAGENRDISDDSAATGPDESFGVEPGVYRHFKGARYEVIGVGRHSETEEPYVFYRTTTTPPTSWVRPLAMFVEPVSRDGYAGPRFVRIEDDAD